MKLKNAAQATACVGDSTRVDTTVAIELAASWKPLMKSKISATTTMSATTVNTARSRASARLRDSAVTFPDISFQIGLHYRLARGPATRVTREVFNRPHCQPDEQRDAEHRAHEERELARVGLIGRRGLGHGGPVSTGMAGSWAHSNQPGS